MPLSQKPPLRILLIEDNPRDVDLTTLLIDEGTDATADIHAVDTLAAALDALSGAHSFAICLVDLGLPDAQGLQAPTALLAHAPDLPVVVLTGLDDDDLGMQALALGCQDYLPKTHLAPDLLIRAVRFAIERKRVDVELRAREADLEDARQRFQDFAEVASDWFWETDADHCFTWMSDSVEAASGLTPSFFVGQRREDLIAAETPAGELQAYAYAIARGEAFRGMEYAVHAPDGGLRWMRISGKPVVRDGRVVGYRGVGSDVSRYKQMRDELRQQVVDLEASRDLMERQAAGMAALAEESAAARIEAEAANRAKSDFLATMSHEIRTPLTGLLGMADALLAGPLPATPRSQAQDLRQAGETLLNILNDILDVSKIEAGHLDLESFDVPLDSLGKAAVNAFSQRAADQGTRLSVHLDHTLPPVVRGDGHRLKQVLFNLVGNAVKFTRDGTVGIHITGSRPETNRVDLRIEVRDTGPGIPPAVQTRLFTRYTQAGADTARTHGGTGLGLAVCKQLVDLMDGQIGVTSTPGDGSTFWVTLSLPVGDARAAIPADDGPTIDMAPARPLRILVAEDNDMNQRVIAALLADFGDLRMVANGARAVEAAAAEAFDIILMDARMPEMNGMEATSIIRRSDGPNAAIPIVALSADAMPEHVTAFREAGMTLHIAKPIDRRALRHTILDLTGAATRPVGASAAAATAADSQDADETARQEAAVAAFLASIATEEPA